MELYRYYDFIEMIYMPTSCGVMPHSFILMSLGKTLIHTWTLVRGCDGPVEKKLSSIT
jgi:hypothetical protein